MDFLANAIQLLTNGIKKMNETENPADSKSRSNMITDYINNLPSIAPTLYEPYYDAAKTWYSENIAWIGQCDLNRFLRRVLVKLGVM